MVCYSLYDFYNVDIPVVRKEGQKERIFSYMLSRESCYLLTMIFHMPWLEKSITTNPYIQMDGRGDKGLFIAHHTRSESTCSK